MFTASLLVNILQRLFSTYFPSNVATLRSEPSFWEGEQPTMNNKLTTELQKNVIWTTQHQRLTSEYEVPPHNCFEFFLKNQIATQFTNQDNRTADVLRNSTWPLKTDVGRVCNEFRVSRITLVNESCDTKTWVMSHSCMHTLPTRHPYWQNLQWIQDAHIWMSHGTFWSNKPPLHPERDFCAWFDFKKRQEEDPTKHQVLTLAKM